MQLRKMVGAVVLAAAIGAIGAVPMKLHVVQGRSLVWSAQSAGWVAVSDSADLQFGDSVFVDSNEEIKILVGDGITLKLKGVGRIGLIGNGLDLTVALVEGQLFLRREQPYQMNMFMVTARQCQFIPVGTTASVKFTKTGDPSVAMLEGQMRMQGPTGEAVLVGAGHFATFDIATNAVKQGELPPAAIAALQEWAGTAPAEVAPEQAAPDSAATPDSGQATAVLSAPPGDSVADVPQEPLQPEVAATQAEPLPAQQAGVEPQPAAPEQSPEPAAVVEPAAPAQSATQEVAEPQKKEKKPKKEKQQSQGLAKGAAVGEPAQSKETQEPKADKEAGDEPKGDEQEGSKKDKDGDGGRDKPVWGISAGPVTVGDEQWTRIAFFGDIPIWKFGLGIDVELFMNADGQFDKKGWDFKEKWVEAVSRKLVYIRFQHETDPVFAKFGGLSDVTLGYGFVMDRFTNMLHYPDEKQLGLQLYLNDIGPIGVTLQSIVVDFKDFRSDGGIAGARAGLKPLKFTEMPILKGLQVAATYVRDINQYAPARNWDFTLTGPDENRDGDLTSNGETYFDGPWVEDFVHSLTGDSLSPQERLDAIAAQKYDTLIEHKDQWASRRTDAFAVFGLDASVPILSGKLIGLDIYGQFAMSMDVEGDDDTVTTEGWGIGAPGVALRAGPLWGRVEFRHTNGQFTPGYFGPYYQDERLWRIPTISDKESRLVDEELNGLYGTLGANIQNVLTIEGRYQYLIPRSDNVDPDHRFEAIASVGSMIIEKIPKISKVEGFVYKTNIGSYQYLDDDGEGQTDSFFEKTPWMYWGYRLGFEVMPGAGIIWEARYGWLEDQNGDLKKNDNISIQASLTF